MIGQFTAWCEREGIALTTKQQAAAAAILNGLAFLGWGRGSGKSFVLAAITRFLDEAHL